MGRRQAVQQLQLVFHARVRRARAEDKHRRGLRLSEPRRHDKHRRLHLLPHRYGFPCGGHFIFGLPGETRDMMLHAAGIISGLPLTTVKFHQLQIFKDTAMAEEYLSHPSGFRLFSLEEYIEFVIDFVERLNPNIVIERFAGEVPPRFLVSKPWESLRYDQVLAMIEKRM